MTSDDTKPLSVAGIGASAGGLDALEKLLSQLPESIEAAIVVVTHTHRDQPSLLPEILERATEVPVVKVKPGHSTRLEPGHIYVPATGHRVFLDSENLRLGPLDDGDLGLPIDSFFRSLALDRGARAIGVILSGTGTDGTVGLGAIKEAGGFAMVQSGCSTGEEAYSVAIALHERVRDHDKSTRSSGARSTRCRRSTTDGVEIDVELPGRPSRTLAVDARQISRGDQPAYVVLAMEDVGDAQEES